MPCNITNCKHKTQMSDKINFISMQKTTTTTGNKYVMSGVDQEVII